MKVVDLGQAGKATVFVDVRWLDLSTEKFVALRSVMDELDKLALQELPPASASQEAHDDSDDRVDESEVG